MRSSVAFLMILRSSKWPFGSSKCTLCYSSSKTDSVILLTTSICRKEIVCSYNALDRLRLIRDRSDFRRRKCFCQKITQKCFTRDTLCVFLALCTGLLLQGTLVLVVVVVVVTSSSSSNSSSNSNSSSCSSCSSSSGSNSSNTSNCCSSTTT